MKEQFDPKARKKGCRFVTNGNTTEIHLPSDDVAMIDTQDLYIIRDYKWFATRSARHTNVYVYAKVKRKTIPLHVLLLAASHPEIDHKDGDGLNNRRKNLRPATSSQNRANSRKTSTPKSSIYKGVSFHRGWGINRWRADIGTENTRIHLGLFDTEREAAQEYDRAAIHYFREFARLNFPRKLEEYKGDPFFERQRITHCVLCHVPLEYPRLGKRFCSKICRGLFHRGTPHRLPLVHCRWCGAKLRKPKLKRLFCSDRCKKAAWRAPGIGGN